MLISSSPSSPFMFKPPPPCPPPTHHSSRPPTLNSSQPMESGPSPSPIPMGPVKGRAKATKKKTLHLGGDEMKEEGGAPSKKPKSSKKKTSVDLDEEEEGERRTKGQWKDFWVDQLIHVRGGMSEEFNNPQKQGINLWAKIASRLASSTYHDFNKDSEACRKKWAAVLAQYWLDKAHNATSGNDRKHTCKWYDVMDEYYHDRAQVNCVSHASSTTVADTIATSEAVETKTPKCPKLKFQ
ncbi:hypothetical protein L7F22_048187 [Adiantum nelumboides]|nr:hypothetical protein [Adiantum nelumboides]